MDVCDLKLLVLSSQLWSTQYRICFFVCNFPSQNSCYFSRQSCFNVDIIYSKYLCHIHLPEIVVLWCFTLWHFEVKYYSVDGLIEHLVMQMFRCGWVKKINPDFTLERASVDGT